MALANRSDLAELTPLLHQWVSRWEPRAHDVRVTGLSMSQANGMSTETVAFDAAWSIEGDRREAGLIARIAPSGEGIYPEYDFERESTILCALESAVGVPAPRVVDYDGDPALLGAQYLVLERLIGRVPSDDPPWAAQGWVVDLPPERQGLLHDNALAILAELHRLDWSGLGLAALDRPRFGARGLGEQLGYWRGFYDWASAGEPVPLIEAAFDWLDAARPAENPDRFVLCWGDARIGNMLFGEDLAVTGVLDWEMAALAEPELDLGWWLFTLDYLTTGVGLPVPAGFPDREAIIARYQQLAGRPVSNLHYYEVLAGVRLSILSVRAARIMIEAGLLPADSQMAHNNPASQLLARTLGHGAPAGASENFIGNRSNA